MKNNLKKTPTEFEIQAEAFHRLKAEYPIVRGEVRLQFPRKVNGKWARRDGMRRGARFDIVVCDENETWLFTVEVKDSELCKAHAKQAHYEELSGVPNVLIAGMGQAENVCAIAREAVRGGFLDPIRSA